MPELPDVTIYLKRASMHVLSKRHGLASFDRGGYEILEGDLPGFVAALRRENRTLKRALTDPRLFSGVGNAYSDEILFRARLSPMQLTSRLAEEAVQRLFAAAEHTLSEWTARTRAEVGEAFPSS